MENGSIVESVLRGPYIPVPLQEVVWQRSHRHIRQGTEEREELGWCYHRRTQSWLTCTHQYAHINMHTPTCTHPLAHTHQTPNPQYSVPHASHSILSCIADCYSCLHFKLTSSVAAYKSGNWNTYIHSDWAHDTTLHLHFSKPSS